MESPSTNGLQVAQQRGTRLSNLNKTHVNSFSSSFIFSKFGLTYCGLCESPHTDGGAEEGGVAVGGEVQ